MEPEVESTEPLSVEEALEKSRSKSVFSGHPAAAGDETDEPEDGGDDTPEPKAADVDKDDSESNDDATEPDPDPDPPVKKKYASHEEAEKGAKEAERRMHEAIEEARKMRLEVEEIRKQIASASKTGEITQQQKKDLSGYFENMLKSINELDPEDPEYQAKLAKAWAGSIESSVGEILSEENAKRQEQQRRAEADRAESAKIGTKVVDMATKAGLDMSSEQSPDYDLFWSVAQNAVGDTVDDRINWAIGKVNSLKATIVEKTISSQKKSKEAQNKNKVLERGVSPTSVPKTGEDVKPLSIMEALARTERRI